MTDISPHKIGSKTLSQPVDGYADGRVVHHRLSPRKHYFENRMYWHLIDLQNVAGWASQSSFRSHNGFNIYGLYDKDYVDNREAPIYEKIVAYLNKQSGQDFNGRVMLMTHPRYLGVGFNSVSFYLCYQHKQLQYIVSEINNTPWGDKHLYFHDCQSSNNSQAAGGVFVFDKAFHISPFVAMDIRYQWLFVVSENALQVKMKLFKDNQQLMYVGLDTRLIATTDKQSRWLTVKRPAQAWKMWLSIYYQALRLWLKRIPFQDHPKHKSQP